jgi:hypothetical protein
VQVDLETLQARVASLSYVAMMDGGARAQLLGAVSDLARERGLVAADGHLVTPYRTHALWCRRAQA